MRAIAGEPRQSFTAVTVPKGSFGLGGFGETVEEDFGAKERISERMEVGRRRTGRLVIFATIEVIRAFQAALAFSSLAIFRALSLAEPSSSEEESLDVNKTLSPTSQRGGPSPASMICRIVDFGCLSRLGETKPTLSIVPDQTSQMVEVEAKTAGTSVSVSVSVSVSAPSGVRRITKK